MKRTGTTLLVMLGATLFFVAPAAASSDPAPHTPPPAPSHPTPPPPPSDPSFSVPPSSPPASPSHAEPSHPAPASHPATPSHPAAPSTGSAVSEVAKGLGQTVSAAAKAGDTSAVHAAIEAHRTAVTTAAHDGAGDTTHDTAEPDQGNSVNAKGFGAQVSALAHATDGAKGATVSAFATTLGELVRSGALTLGEGGQHVASAADPDTALESGVVADDDDAVQPGALPDVAFAQLIG